MFVRLGCLDSALEFIRSLNCLHSAPTIPFIETTLIVSILCLVVHLKPLTCYRVHICIVRLFICSSNSLLACLSCRLFWFIGAALSVVLVFHCVPDHMAQCHGGIFYVCVWSRSRLVRTITVETILISCENCHPSTTRFSHSLSTSLSFSIVLN